MEEFMLADPVKGYYCLLEHMNWRNKAIPSVSFQLIVSLVDFSLILFRFPVWRKVLIVWLVDTTFLASIYLWYLCLKQDFSDQEMYTMSQSMQVIFKPFTFTSLTLSLYIQLNAWSAIRLWILYNVLFYYGTTSRWWNLGCMFTSIWMSSKHDHAWNV